MTYDPEGSFGCHAMLTAYGLKRGTKLRRSRSALTRLLPRCRFAKWNDLLSGNRRARRAELSPHFHEFSSAIEKVAAQVRRLRPVSDNVAQCGLGNFPWNIGPFGGPNSEGRTETMHGQARPFHIVLKVLPHSRVAEGNVRRRSETTRPRDYRPEGVEGHAKPSTLPWPKGPGVLARSLCVRGTVHTVFLKSISCNVTFRVSPLRAAVRIVNTRALAETVLRFERAAKNAGRSSYGIASKCVAL